jgi:peptidyl-prolyl cis-trans isomerase D
MAKDEGEGRKGPNPLTRTAVWVLMGLLLVGLAGFGIENFGGRVATIGQVGDRDIGTTDYARALQQEQNALAAQIGEAVTFGQLQALGLDARVRQGLVLRAALDNEAERMGLSVGDATVANEVRAIPAFQGLDGQFDRVAYAEVVAREGLTEAEFETRVREDVARSLLQGAIVGGFEAPAAMAGTLYAWVGERRGFSLLRLTEADLAAPLAAGSDADLQAFHAANIARFTAPEKKRIAYAVLLPETLAPGMALDETALRAAYDARIDTFVQPERRLVERLVYPDDSQAAAARARLDAGEVTFDALVAERGLTMTDVDMGDVTPADLGEAGPEVFALAAPGVVGPLPSEFGPALFRMNAVLAAQEVTFDEARADLAAEAQSDAARREIAGRVEAINDALAGGAALADLATEQGMTVGTLDYVPGGPNADPLAGYLAFQNAADALAEGDFPEALLLDDGGVAVLELTEIVPPTPIPFEAARADVEAAWRADALRAALAARGIEMKAAVEGGAAIGSLGIVEVTTEIARQGFIEGTPAQVVEAAFQMDEGQVRLIEAGDFVGLLRLDRIIPAEEGTEDATALREALAVQIEQAIAQDAFAAYQAALSAEAGITLNQQAIDAVHATFPQ